MFEKMAILRRINELEELKWHMITCEYTNSVEKINKAIEDLKFQISQYNFGVLADLDQEA